MKEIEIKPCLIKKPSLCLLDRKVPARPIAEHIAVSDDNVSEFNQLASAVIYNWDLEINNNDPATDKDILNAIQNIME